MHLFVVFIVVSLACLVVQLLYISALSSAATVALSFLDLVSSYLLL